MSLTIVVVYPDLLGTYGDGGNGVVLAQRARWRGIGASLVESSSEESLPEADIYCLGGGEDGPQLRACELLAADGGLHRAVERGAVVLAVCAGYQIAGRSFPAADGSPLPGLGLLDVTTKKGTGERAVGEILAQSATAELPLLTGFENHGGITRRGQSLEPLARVISGIGNGDTTEGALSGHVVGTYLHGPVLARNPALADRLLAWATGTVLASLEDDEERALHAERVSAIRNGAQRWRVAPSLRSIAAARLARLPRSGRP